MSPVTREDWLRALLAAHNCNAHRAHSHAADGSPIRTEAVRRG